MTGCIICAGERERDLENNLLCCRRCWGRLAGALRQIPVLVEELRGLGYIQRDRRPRTDDAKGRGDWADPVAYGLPAGPLNGLRNGAKVSGSPGRSAPIRIDPTDLLGRPRAGSLAVAARSPWPDDQVGHLAVASVLDFWARDWADLRGERPPDLAGERSPAILCAWLADRLDWACRHHFALDEFAGDVSKLLGALYGLAGHGASRPKVMEAACPGCRLLTLHQPYPEAYIECVAPDCGRVITPTEYEEYVMDMRHEIRALDVLAALNGGEPVQLDGVTFAVITKGYTESYEPTLGKPVGLGREEFYPFVRGELLVLRGGRELLGLARRPGKWPVTCEQFTRLEDAIARREQLLGETP